MTRPTNSGASPTKRPRTKADDAPEIRIHSWVRSTDDEQRTGLLGWLSIQYGLVVFDGITARRTESGKFTLSFPARTDRSGRRHAYIRPVDDAARRAIEAAVFGQATLTSEVKP